MVDCSHPQDNSLSMHINMHYTPSTTHMHPTAFHNPPMHTTNKHKAYLCKWRQNGTRCRDGVKVLWYHFHLVWLVFKGSVPTCACFHSEIFCDLYTKGSLELLTCISAKDQDRLRTFVAPRKARRDCTSCGLAKQQATSVPEVQWTL